MNSLAERVLVGAAATVDRAFLAAIRRGGKSSSGGSVPGPGDASRGRALEALTALAERYEPLRWAGDAAFFPRPRRALVGLDHVRTDPWGRGGAVWDGAWASDFEPFLDDARSTFDAARDNRAVHGRFYLGGRGGASAPPRPAVVLLHGYNAGHFALAERTWPIAWLDALGLDVLFLQLPFHGRRASSSSVAALTHLPPFPSEDPVVTVEGFRQAVSDVRSAVHWFVGRGAPAVGVMGQSLGAYAASLVATLEPELAFAVPVTPLASLADFVMEQGGLRSTDEHRALARVYEPISPFARPCLVPAHRTVVVAADADRVTPLSHARRLAAHLGASVATYPGSHLVHRGIAQGYEAAARMLVREGIVRGLPR